MSSASKNARPVLTSSLMEKTLVVGNTVETGLSRMELSHARVKVAHWCLPVVRFQMTLNCDSNGVLPRAATAVCITDLANTSIKYFNPRTSAASLYFCMAPSHDATKPPMQWNTGRVVCKGTVIQHWLNGKKVIDFDYKDEQFAFNVDLLKKRGGDLAARGANLSLQDHGDPVW